jgi:integrase
MAYIETLKNKKGTTYRALIRIKGYKSISKTFDKKTEAKEWAVEVERQMKKGKYRQIDKDLSKPIATVGELITYFEDNVAPKRYTKPDQYKFMYNWWRNKIGHILLSELDSPLLEKCQNLLAAEAPDKPYKNHAHKSNSTVRKYMFALSAVLTYGVRSLKAIERNPMSDIDKPQKPKGVVRFLSDEEKEILIKACKDHSLKAFVFVMIALFAGGRYAEILTLQVENIDFENSMLHFTDTKNKEPRGVPVYEKITQIIKNYLDENNIKSGYIFLNKRQKLTYMKGQLEGIIEKTGIENFRIHDLRHTYASWLAQNGATLLEIAELMGHKNLNQVQIYAHLTIKTTAKLVRKMTVNKFDF